MSNPNLGLCRCPVCGNPDAGVRKAKGTAGRLYLHCAECSGPLFLRLAKGQDYILNNARMNGPNGEPDGTGKPAPTAAPAPAPAAPPAPKPAPPPAATAPKRGGLNAWLP